MKNGLKRLLCFLLLAAMLVNGIAAPAAAASGSTIAVSDGVSLTLSKPYVNTIRLKVHNSGTYTVETVDVYVVEEGTKITWPAGYTYDSEEWHVRDTDGVYYSDIGGVGYMPWLSDDPNAAATFTVDDYNTIQHILILGTTSSSSWESGEPESIGRTHFILKSAYDSLYADKSKLLEKGGDAKFGYISTFTEENVSYGYYYNEAWFLKNPTVYNHDLAQMSIRVAMAAAQTEKYTIESLFDDLEYDNIDCSYPPPTKDTIGYTIADKEIADSSGKAYQLIAVAVRGGGYGAEWANNFLVGTGTEHKGFSDAADKVVKAVKDRMKELGTDKNFKIWITGYSRAAATSNLVAHQLNLDAKYNLSYLDESDIFAYCFECPAGVTGAEATFAQVADKNIFNIVNPIDLVPMVAPRKWGFQRYGVTYYLPSSEINYKNYKKAFGAMKEEYRKISSAAGVSSKDLSDALDFMKAQNGVLQNFIDVASGELVSQKNFANNLQSTVVAAVNSCANEKIDVGDVVIAVLGVSAMSSNPAIQAAAITILAYIDEISNAHYPELCLAWMDAITDADMNRSAYTRYLRVNCPVDVSVYDSKGVLVARIVDDAVQEIEDGIGAMVDENGQKIIVMPFDEAFRIVTTATGNGEMSYQVEEYDLAAAETLRVINYYDVEISEGDELTGTAGSSTEANAAYTLEGTDGSELTASIEQTGADVSTFSIRLDSDGNGEVAGGGSFVVGEFAKLTAVPGNDEQFLGWYAGDQLLSMETEYRFRVECDMEIVGKFTRNRPEVYRLAGATRYDTAFKAADQLKANLGIEKFQNIVVAYGEDFADALSGSYLANQKNAPILLVKNRNKEINLVKDYIKANLTSGGTVYLLGGVNAVPKAMEDGLEGFNVKRLAGATRYETNLEILKEAGISGNDILVCTGLDFADGLSASAVNKPILLVKDSLRTTQVNYLKTLGTKNFYLIGGTNAVNKRIESTLGAYGTTQRIEGATRYYTSVNIAKAFFPDAKCAVLAYAQNFPDGLSGGCLACSMNAPLILTANGKQASAVAYAKEAGITGGAVLGGTGLIPDRVANAIFQIS